MKEINSILGKEQFVICSGQHILDPIFNEYIWKDIPSSLKDLSVFAFPKQIKRYLLSEQKLN